MGYTFLFNFAYSNLNSIFNILICNNDVISMFGQQKHIIFETEPFDFLKMLLGIWSFEPHFLANFFLIKKLALIEHP